MQIDDVRRRVAEIEGMAEDDESAHSAEDALHQDVLAEIAKLHGASDHPPAVWAAEMAAEALKTRKFSFCRWYA